MHSIFDFKRDEEGVNANFSSKNQKFRATIYHRALSKSVDLSSSDTWAAPKISGLGELVCKFARKALVPFHEPHKGIDRSDPRASALFQLERNTRRGAAADSIHNRARTIDTLMGNGHRLRNLRPFTHVRSPVPYRTCDIHGFFDICASQEKDELLKKKKRKKFIVRKLLSVRSCLIIFIILQIITHSHVIIDYFGGEYRLCSLE